jgi:hypothetical protein
MATLSLGVLTAGLLWPHLAMVFLQALLLTLALAYLSGRLHKSKLPAALASDSYSPFEVVASTSPPATRPPAIRQLSRVLTAAGDQDAAQRVPIPAEIRRVLYAEGTRRLSEHHGLSPHRLEDRDRVNALLSTATQSLLRAGSVEKGGPPEAASIPMSLLANILDDVERL